MKKAEDYLLEHLTPLLGRAELAFNDIEEIKQQPEWDVTIAAIKQAQIDAIGEAVKRCYNEFELFEIDGVAVGIDYNSAVKVSEQLRKEIEWKKLKNTLKI